MMSRFMISRCCCNDWLPVRGDYGLNSAYLVETYYKSFYLGQEEPGAFENWNKYHAYFLGFPWTPYRLLDEWNDLPGSWYRTPYITINGRYLGYEDFMVVSGKPYSIDIDGGSVDAPLVQIMYQRISHCVMPLDGRPLIGAPLNDSFLGEPVTSTLRNVSSDFTELQAQSAGDLGQPTISNWGLNNPFPNGFITIHEPSDDVFQAAGDIDFLLMHTKEFEQPPTSVLPDFAVETDITSFSTTALPDAWTWNITNPDLFSLAAQTKMAMHATAIEDAIPPTNFFGQLTYNDFWGLLLRPAWERNSSVDFSECPQELLDNLFFDPDDPNQSFNRDFTWTKRRRDLMSIISPFGTYEVEYEVSY